LARARIDAIEKLYTLREQLWQRGSATILSLITLPRQAHAAFVEGGIVGDARIAWAQKNLERMSRLEALGKQRYEAGAAGADEQQEIAIARTEAEFWLEEARQAR
jgi:hypothetical protein